MLSDAETTMLGKFLCHGLAIITLSSQLTSGLANPFTCGIPAVRPKRRPAASRAILQHQSQSEQREYVRPLKPWLNPLASSLTFVAIHVRTDTFISSCHQPYQSQDARFHFDRSVG
ncbi:hypothetical protein BGX38DRAFT_1206403 [Terfezia claveryi]|nr:hypothetical protein BGX38DRAFT_1206403 [Terfezia claveryi]